MMNLPASRIETAASTLEARGLVGKVADSRYASFQVAGRYYCYTSKFWERVGLLDGPTLDSEGREFWHVREDPEHVQIVRAAATAMWVDAGAPLEWAVKEIDDALTNEQFVDIGLPWLTA